VLHASCAIPLAPIRLMIVQAHLSNDQPPPHSPPQPRVARCPTCGTPMCVVMRLWPVHRDCVDTGCAVGLCPAARGATRGVHPTAPVRPHPAIRLHKMADGESATAFRCPADASRGSAEAPIAMPHPGVRPMPPSLS
jgi:hypothetical protein